jgi:hypothetical protein
LVLIGAIRLATRQGKQLWAAGLVIAGSWFLLINLGLINAEYFDLWPLFLIGIGGALIYSAVRSGDRDLPGGGDGAADPAASGVRVSHTAVLTAKKTKLGPRSFRAGNLTACMGGCELDLSAARIEGDEAVLDCVAFWGGIEIVVPPEWWVVNEVTAVMGGLEDKTEPPAIEDAPRLRLTGYAVMGGIEVRNSSQAHRP